MDNDVRARIGFIVPSGNVLTERQMRLYAPADVQAYAMRMRLTRAYHVPPLEALPRIVEAAEVLADAGCDMIVFHCTASSMEAGVDGDRRIVEAMAQATGTRCTSTASAVHTALEALAIRKLVLVSPYQPATHQHEIDFLAQAGIEVLGGRAMDFPSGAYSTTTPERWIEVMREERQPQADAYFLSCTNIQSLEAIEPLEAELGRPVIASNQATLWYALRALGLDDRLPRLGRLFTVDTLDRAAAAA
jgi:maleate cis-trans isomerase